MLFRSGPHGRGGGEGVECGLDHGEGGEEAEEADERLQLAAASLFVRVVHTHGGKATADDQPGRCGAADTACFPLLRNGRQHRQALFGEKYLTVTKM